MTPPTPPAKHSTLFGVVYAWLAAHVFKYVPSPVLELASGLLLVALFVAIVLLLEGPVAVLALATAGSVLYEYRLDPNGWSWVDVGEREVGIIAGVYLATALKLL